MLHQASPKDIAQLLLEGKADVGIATDTLEENAGIVALPLLFLGARGRCAKRATRFSRAHDLSLEAIAEYPIITYDEGLTGPPAHR